MDTYFPPNIPMRPYPPLKADHPIVGAQDCAACHQRFQAGDVTTILPLGPGDDPEARQKARAGRPYNAVGALLHWACATGEEMP